MQKDIFNVEKFNILQDNEYYYFFRALNTGDNIDLENGIITDENGSIVEIRTDQDRWNELDEGVPKYDRSSDLTLSQVFDHIKMHNRKDTNCISLSSNANVAISYGRKNYKDRYVIVKIPKKEFGKEAFNAGEYMLSEIEKAINDTIKKLDSSDVQARKVLSKISMIDEVTSDEEIAQIISMRYIAQTELPLDENPDLRKGILYSAPTARISNWKVLDEEQALEKNKLIAKLTLLERNKLMPPIIKNTSDNRLLIQTVGNAFASLEQIHYGEIEQEKILDVQKELVDIFALLQQVPSSVEKIEELKQEVIKFANQGRRIELPNSSNLLRKDRVRENISIEEMYELTGGKVQYGDANSIIEKIFYLSKSRLNAREFSNIIRQIVENNHEYEDVIKYIQDNCFEVEPEIVTRRSSRSYLISESVSFDFNKNEEQLIDDIKKLTNAELIEILENGGYSNVKNLMLDTFSRSKKENQISINEYYAEAIISSIDWTEIGIEGFSINQKNDFIRKLAKEDVRNLYLKLESAGIERNKIPTYILNIVSNNKHKNNINQENYLEYLNENRESLNSKLSITQIETFLGYYKQGKTELILRDYQQEAVENVDKIFENKKFAFVMLPTGAGKSFVSLAEMLKHKDEPILYLAPQNEILEQMKDNILQYVIGKTDSLNRDEDIKKAFPNLEFLTYSGLKTKEGKRLIKEKKSLIVLDELHRTGAPEWEKSVNRLLENQDEAVRVLGMTATPIRDIDDRNMADETAKKLGYLDEEIEDREYIAKEIDLQTAIQLGLVVNPRIISFIYKLNGNLEELSTRIQSLEAGTEKETLLKEYGKIEEKYQKARKYVSEAEGISDILKNNLKAGGKYIVFVPVRENEIYEDEDGNRIGRISATQKIEEYKKKIAEEYLKNTGIKPKFYSMLGEYGDKINSSQLKEFENDDSEETKFLVVINKANEGLHIEKLDGMLWFRDIDESSLILISQQLGRVIFAEDPNSPTREEDKPLVFDACNNILKLLHQKNIRNARRSDLLLLEEVVNWSKNHNQIPDIDSSNKKEQRYAATLYRIQNKYSKYLDNPAELEQLDDKAQDEIRRLLSKGSEIDLWEIYLPPKDNSEIDKKAGVDFFEVESLITDFVNIEERVEQEEEKTTIEQTLEIARILNANGVDLSKLVLSRKYKGKQHYFLLKELKQEGVDINKIIEDNNLDGDYPWRDRVMRLRMAYNGTSSYKISDAERKEAEKLGLVSPKGKTIAAKTLEIARILTQNGVDLSKIPLSTGNGRERYFSLKEIKQDGIDIKKIIEENGLDGNYPWGKRVMTLRLACKGIGGYAITEDEEKEAERLGLISPKEKTIVEQTLEIARILTENGVDLRKVTSQVTVDGKRRKTLLKDIKQNGIDINKIIEENGLDAEYPWGQRLYEIRGAYSGTKAYKITEQEKKEAERLGLIVPKEKSAISQTLEIAKILNENGVDLRSLASSKKQNGKQHYFLLKELTQDGIDINKIIEENGLDGNYPWGMRVKALKKSYLGSGTCAIQDDERKEAESLGLIPEATIKLARAKEARDAAKTLNDKAREKESKLEKGTKNYEE